VRQIMMLWLCAGLVCSGLGRVKAESQKRQPNFVIIMADDLGYGDIACFGNQKINTPHIDALARDGMKFTDFHSNGAVCSPTRAALVTGRYQQRSGVEGVVTAKSHRDQGMALAETTFAEVLGPAGYTSGIFGKWHLGYPAQYNPVHQGFSEFAGFVSGNIDYHSHVDQEMYLDWWQGDRIDNEPGYLTDLVTNYGVAFIKKHQTQPFCLYLAHGAPHYPYQGRQDPAIRQAGVQRPGREIPDVERRYKEMIEVMDEGVGRIVSTIKDLGLQDKTLVFFLSDNGPTGSVISIFNSTGPLRGSKGTLWEGGHRVPAVASWPGHIRVGSVSHATALGMDLLVTMASLAGATLPVDRSMDGVDLSPVLLGTGTLAPRTVFWRAGKGRVARRGPWKLLVQGQKAQLFNLDDDLGETKDLVQAHPQITAELRKALETWEAEVSQGVTRISG
jgi:arylsulfatase A-like enzyme